MPLACHSSQLHLRINFGFLGLEEGLSNYKPGPRGKNKKAFSKGLIVM